MMTAMISALAEPPPARAQPAADARLAADLGHVLDAILDHTAQGVLHQLGHHRLSPAQARLLQALDRTLAAVDAADLAVRTGLDEAVAARELRGLRERGLVVERAHARRAALTLTEAGRRVIADLDAARRRDLRAYVDSLDPTSRIRLEAAVTLLEPAA